MKYRILTLLSGLFLCICSVSAQEAPETPKNVIWGIKGNLNAELPGKHKINKEIETSYTSGFGASIGALSNIYLGRNFYFEPEAALFFGSYSDNVYQEVAPNSPSVNVGPRIYKLGLRIPFNFGYYININEKWGLNVFTGPQLNYAFYGRAEYDEGVEYDGVITPHIFKGKNGQNRFELGWKIGVGFPVEHFLISLEADLGITNLMKNKTTFRENRVGLGISYYF